MPTHTPTHRSRPPYPRKHHIALQLKWLLNYRDQQYGYEQSSTGDYYIRGIAAPVKPGTILKDWHAIIKRTPASLRDAVREPQGEAT